MWSLWNIDTVHLLSGNPQLARYIVQWADSFFFLFQGECICVTILKMYVSIHLSLCGLLPATHGRARQLNTGGNCHSVCLWNPNVSSKGWDPELWNNVKAHCVSSAREMSNANMRQRRPAAHGGSGHQNDLKNYTLRHTDINRWLGYV